MQPTRPLDVVFLTNYTDYCYRSIPAIAQMADDFAMRLTIVHATGSSNPRNDLSRKQLQSFFPEADSYADSRRHAIAGDPVEAVGKLREEQAVDLLIAPAADPLGIPRIGHRSLRARLLRECKIPLWTIGRRTKPAKLRIAPRHVGCWIDFHEGWMNHVVFAREYAWRIGADLHILHALPDVHDGMWLRDDQPLRKEGVAEEVTKRIGWSPVPMHFHVAENDRRGSRTRLIEESSADVVFAADRQPGWPSWLSSKPRLLDECACPVIHIPVDTQVPVWQLVHEIERPAAAKADSYAWRWSGKAVARAAHGD